MVPTRCSFALWDRSPACVLLLRGGKALCRINYINYSIKGINPASCQGKNSCGLSFEEVSRSSQVNYYELRTL